MTPRTWWAAAVLLVASCASTDESLQLARSLDAEVAAYQAQLTTKIAEQRRFYRARSAATSRAEGDILAAAVEQLRSRLAAVEANSMAGDPEREARPGALARFLLDTAAAERDLDTQSRQRARSDEAELAESLRKLQLQQDALQRLHTSLQQLSSRRRTRAEARALIEYATAVRKEIGDAGSR